MTTFKNYQFKGFIFDTLDKMNFKNPTPIQELVIPLALQGKDVIGKSPTGSGKTHAYLLPILNKINTSIDKVQAVILTPTRELATQIYENLVMFQKYDQKLKLRLITGGLDRARMIEKVNNTPHIVIGTPGRIKDIGLDKAEFNLMSTDILVLDEPTRGLDPIGQDEIMELFNNIFLNHHKTIVLISHDMNIVYKYATRCIVMKDSKIAFDGTKHELFVHDKFDEFSLEKPDILNSIDYLNKKLDLNIPYMESLDNLINYLKGGDSFE